MAIVSVGFSASVTLGGVDDGERQVDLFFDATVTDYAGAVSALNAHLTELAKVSSGVVKSYIVRSKAVQDAYSRPSTYDTESTDTAMLIARVANNPVKTGNLFIPYPKIGIFVATAGKGYKEVDIADADVLSYVLLWQTGKNTFSDGEKMGNLIGGKRL